MTAKSLLDFLNRFQQHELANMSIEVKTDEDVLEVSSAILNFEEEVRSFIKLPYKMVLYLKAHK